MVARVCFCKGSARRRPNGSAVGRQPQSGVETQGFDQIRPRHRESTFMAWCVWFPAPYFPAKVPATAPTSHQLEDVLWSEIAKWHRVMKERLRQLGSSLNGRLGLSGSSRRRMKALRWREQAVQNGLKLCKGFTLTTSCFD